jgi:hypothetical protein
VYSSGGSGEEGDCWRTCGTAAKEGIGGRGTAFSLSVLAGGADDSVVDAGGSGDFGGGAESSFEGRTMGAGGNAGGLRGGGAFGMGKSVWTILDQVSFRAVHDS